MTDTPRIIYRHPKHAGRKPVTKSVQRGDLPMLTLNPQRLARAGSVQSIIVRRRAFGWRAVAILLLLVALLVVALAAASRVRAQTFEIGAPCLKCVYLPMVQR